MSKAQTNGLPKQSNQLTEDTPVLSYLVNVVRSAWDQSSKGFLQVDGESFNISDLFKLSRLGRPIKISEAPEVKARIESSINFLAEQVAQQKSIYGVTTGYGGSSDHAYQETSKLQESLIRHLNAAFGEPLKVEIVRGAMAIRLNSVAKGVSGIRMLLLENLIQFLNKGITPVVPAMGSVSASGDLHPLSFIVACIMGKPGHYCTVGPEEKKVTSAEALKLAGVQPIVLQAKEGLALVNGTSMSASAGVLVLIDAIVLMLLSLVETAMATEALNGQEENYDYFTSFARPHQGQADVAKALFKLVQPSHLVHHVVQNEANPPVTHEDTAFLLAAAPSYIHETDPTALRQDRYPLRTAPQWLGPHIEQYVHHVKVMNIEINSTTDNPLIDVQNQRVVHGGNFQAASVGVMMDNLRLSIQNVGKLVFTQHSDLVNKFHSFGLPANLAWLEPGLDYGMKGVDTNMAAYMAELAYVAGPVTTHVQSAELHNQSVNSLALVSARANARAIDLLQRMTAAHLNSLVQSIDIRHLQVQIIDSLLQHLAKCTHNLCYDGLQLSAEPAESMENRLAEVFADGFGALYKLSQLQFSSRVGLVQLVERLIEHIRDYVAESSIITSAHEFQRYNNALVQWQETFINGAEEIINKHRREYVDGSAAPLLGLSQPLYRWVRQDLGVKVNRWDQDPGQQVGIIYDAIRNGSVVQPLLECLKFL